MKYQKVQKQLDEREKLRKFRELDDAFAQALRQLDDPNSKLDIPTGPPVRSLADLEADEQAAQAQQREQLFVDRFRALLDAYDVSDHELSIVVQTLLEYGLWELDKSPTMET